MGARGLGHSLGSKPGMSWLGWDPSFYPQASGFGTLVLPGRGVGVQGTGGPLRAAGTNTPHWDIAYILVQRK